MIIKCSNLDTISFKYVILTLVRDHMSSTLLQISCHFYYKIIFKTVGIVLFRYGVCHCLLGFLHAKPGCNIFIVECYRTSGKHSRIWVGVLTAEECCKQILYNVFYQRKHNNFYSCPRLQYLTYIITGVIFDWLICGVKKQYTRFFIGLAMRFVLRC